MQTCALLVRVVLGKSYFTKLLILRNKYLNLEQFVIDPDREYINLCKYLDGTILKIGPNSNTFINVLDIRKESIDSEEARGYLENKIKSLRGFFYLIFGQISDEEMSILDEKIIQCYNQKGITFKDESLYKYNSSLINPEFKTSKDMPILEDLYNILNNDIKTEKLAINLKPYVYGSLKFLNNYTNINLENELIVADIYDLEKESMTIGMFIIIDLFWNKVRQNRTTKKAIYLDEVWKLIGSYSNKKVAEFVQTIFKTIRKYKGAAIAITQDIQDLFSLEDGKYGRSIINNSSIKVAFSLEEKNIDILNNYINLSEKEKMEIKTLEKGKAWVLAEKDRIILKVEATQKENEVIS